MFRRIFSILVLLFVVSKGFGASFGAWVGLTEKGKFALNPILYSTFDPIIGLDLVTGYGATENIDILANLSTVGYGVDTFSWGGAWLMPRYNLGKMSIFDYNIIGVLLGYSGGFYGGLQYHTSLVFIPNFFVELNLFGTYYDPGLFSYGAIFAPVIKIIDMLSIYFEVDVGMSGDIFTYDLVPGIDLNFGSAGELSLGYKIISQTIGLWYFITF